MLNKITTTFVIVMLSIGLSWSQSENELFEKANKAYLSESYDTAFNLYTQIEELGFYSAELYQNLGTVAFKLDDTPNAIYYFEKGLKLNPGSKDLEHNLVLANKKVVDKTKSDKKSGLTAWLSHFIGNTADHWAKWAVIFSIIGAVSLLVYLFIKQNLINRISLYSGITTWVIAILFIVFSFVQGQHISNKDFAVIFTPSIDIKNEPSEVSSTAFVLHEGTKVKVIETTEDWCKISFSDDKIGWIKLSDCKVI